MEVQPQDITAQQYETIVQELYQAILNSDDIKNVTVQKNVVLKGKSTAPHQIDIYWEFTIAGVKYKTCVECKKLGRNVEKADILEFNSKIEDIGNITGIFVTTKGYQEGATTYGEYKNIRLLRAIPAYSDFLIKEGVINIESLEVDALNWDSKQINTQVRHYRKKHPFFLSFRIRSDDVTRGTLFFNKKGNQVCSFNDLLEPYKGKTGFFTVETPGLYIKTQIGLCSLLSFDLKVSQNYESPQDFILQIEPVYKAMLEDISNNIVYFLKSDGTNIEKIG
jgi:Restriction endonuclease